LWKGGAQRVGPLVLAHRNKAALGQRRQQVEGARQLRAPVELQRCLVAPHAGTAAAREDQPIQRRGHARARVARRRKSRLPPLLETSCTGPMRMSCDSALHMSYTVSAATLAPVSASISTPVVCVTDTWQVITSPVRVARMSIFTPSSGSG